MESDPVVAEIPVYHSTALQRLLHVFCYPLRTQDRPYEASACTLEVVETIGPAATAQQQPAAGAAHRGAGGGGMPAVKEEYDVKKEYDEQAARYADMFAPDPVVTSNNPRFSMKMQFSCAGTMGQSFCGNDPAPSTLAANAFAHLNNNNNSGSGSGAKATGLGSFLRGSGGGRESLLMGDDEDDGFGTADSDAAAGRARRGAPGQPQQDRDVYTYQLDSLPQQQHASYAAALFYNGALHLTRICGIHQFYPRTAVDLQLEAAMIADLTAGASGTTTHTSASGTSSTSGVGMAAAAAAGSTTATTSAQVAAQAAQVGNLRSVPRSLAMSRNAERRAAIDFLDSEQPDCVPIQNMLVAPESEAPGAAAASSAAFNVRTAAQLQRSSSDPGRDEDEMMWALQPFFPFIEGNSFDGTESSLAAARASAGGWANKGHIALKFAHRAMGIDEQVAAVLGMAKLAPLADLQRTVLTPDRNAVPAARLVQALRRVAVCIHGVWATLWDPACAGGTAFVREYVMCALALAEDGCVVARELLQPFQDNQALRKVARSILPLFADLIEVKPSAASSGNQDAAAAPAAGASPPPPKRVWRLRHYGGGAHAKDLLQEAPQEAKAQLAAWQHRHAAVLKNVAALTAGEQLPRQHLVLREVATAGMNQLRGSIASSSGTAGARAAAIASEDMARCRRFVVNAFELHGVLNKALFRERLLSMIKTPQSIIFMAPKEMVQEALKEEVRSFTESTWILQRPVDASTAAIRPYVIQAILEKKTFTTREVEARATQLILADPAQEILPRPTTADGAAGGPAEGEAKPAQPTSLPDHQHTAIVRILNELATWQRAEKMWHIKTGLVQFLAVA